MAERRSLRMWRCGGVLARWRRDELGIGGRQGTLALVEDGVHRERLHPMPHHGVPRAQACGRGGGVRSDGGRGRCRE